MNSKQSRVCLKIFRFNPEVDKNSYYESYEVPLTKEKMNLIQALDYIYREQDNTLAFRRYSCGLQYCNSCMMLINGKPEHACLYILKPGTEIQVAPLAKKRVLRDLVVEESYKEK
jgi:succinate dehydrogenase/fumarate reductase iron-sulfur protein